VGLAEQEAALRIQRHTVGCVRFDKRRGTWNYLFYDQGKRRSKRIGTKKEFPTKASAWKAVVEVEKPEPPTAPAVATLVEQHRTEKMPTRFSTRRGYNAWLQNHVVPKWGPCEITAAQARPVELWLQSLALTPKSRAHIRGLLSTLWMAR
jgi:integrase